MRFFTKLYFVMIIILTVALAFTEYFIMAISLTSAIDNQVDISLKQHQLVKYAIQSDMLSAYQAGESTSESVIKTIGQNAAESLSVELVIIDDTGNKPTIYRTMTVHHPKPEGELSTSQIKYVTVSEGGRYFLEMNSLISQNGLKLRIITITDITMIYDNIRAMQIRCVAVYLAVIFVSIIIVIFFSRTITRPLRNLTTIAEGFSEGDYSKRAHINSKDEIGDLGVVYNRMADTIEEKINELELAVKQREDFTAAFAHELKTPMTSIIGYADTLYQKDLNENEAREAAGFIVNEGMRLESLSFKLLELMTLNNNDFLLEEIEMNDFLKDIEDTIRPAAAKKGVNVFFDYVGGYCRIEFDLFKTLVVNLIDNAMKSGSPDVAVLSQARGDEYMIAIVDHGRGIPKAELKRVTEAFYMVDKARSRKEHGAGLGLALCEKIARIHNTTLDIRSSEGQGTAIRIVLKLVTGGEDEEN